LEELQDAGYRVMAYDKPLGTTVLDQRARRDQTQCDWAWYYTSMQHGVDVIETLKSSLFSYCAVTYDPTRAIGLSPLPNPPEAMVRIAMNHLKWDEASDKMGNRVPYTPSSAVGMDPWNRVPDAWLYDAPTVTRV
jgi:hypothetical protein